MSLTITENNGVFAVEGKLNATTARQMQAHFQLVLNVFGEIAIDIENITEIDSYGFDAIIRLYNDAVENKNNFFMMGKDEHGIYDQLTFDSNSAAA
jgi:anti-anti-sigma regulatory factor